MKFIYRSLYLSVLTVGLWTCAQPPPAPTPLNTAAIPYSTPTAVPATAAPVPQSPTPERPACLDQPGILETIKLEDIQELIVYLPPCYQEDINQRYPVLYLLHGQTYTADQWVRLGAPAAADRLITAEELTPFLIVFPDDRYWNLSIGSGFGQRFLDRIIPYVDEHYRTIPEREQRALGGMSRGGGWVTHLGLTRWELFGALGLHSPAIFQADRPVLDDMIRAIPQDQWPRLWVDIGDNDSEGGYALVLGNLLTANGIPHEWRLYAGAHDEAYWGAHVEEYLRWYIEDWNQSPSE
ncbi:MAG: hypothetical protein JXA13_17340 [Anaerolineales bacterium]|nr:hypothetical protein [Anaerolineales bacterium]